MTQAALNPRAAAVYLLNNGATPEQAQRTLERATPATTWDGVPYYTLRGLDDASAAPATETE